MADNLDDVFSQPLEAAPEDIQPEPEATLEPAPETVEEPTPEPEPQPESQPSKPEPVMVPIAVAHSERDRRQALERENAELRAAQQRKPAPDSFDDPEGYNAYLRAEMQQALQAQKVDMSWAVAVDKHGEETVQAARQWALDKAQRDAGFRSMVDTEFATQPMPINWLVQQHKRDALLSEVGDNVDDWFTREAAKRGYAPQSAPAAVIPAPAVPAPASPPVRVPRSLASNGGSPQSDIRHTASGPLAGVDALWQ